jgi:hypothetical protein
VLGRAEGFGALGIGLGKGHLAALLPPLLLRRALLLLLLLLLRAATEGRADAVLGDPLAALAWLAGRLGVIPAGAWVLSGAMARAIPLERGEHGGRLTLDAGTWGTASLNF